MYNYIIYNNKLIEVYNIIVRVIIINIKFFLKNFLSWKFTSNAQ